MSGPLTTSARGRTLTAAEIGDHAGIRAIGDVHGAFDAFDAALADAEREGRFVVQLGDLIDRGPYSPLCVERMLEVEAAGRGIMIPGNHEIALAQYVRHGIGGAVTRQATLMQFEEHGEGLLERYVARILDGPTWLRLPGHLLVHAAFHPAMLSERVPDGLDLGAIAVHGYGTSAERRSGRYRRSWVEAIPAGLTVVVGHAVTESRAVEAAENRSGGRAVFVDTGAWMEPGLAMGTYDFGAGPSSEAVPSASGMSARS